MYQLLIKDPDYVLIDLPGTGAARVFNALGGTVAGRSLGALPRKWRDRPVIAVIRDPAARLLSVFEAAQVEARYAPLGEAVAQLAGMSPEQMLTMLADWPTPTGFDEQSPQQRLAQALLPQTHPFHGLSEATHILRAETLASDLAVVAAQTGLPLPASISDLPAIDRSGVSMLLRMGLRAAYGGDYAALGYDSQGVVQREVALPLRPTGAPEDLWPAYFTDDTQVAPLPDPDCDLAPFANAWIETPYRPNSAKWKRNPIQHFKELEPEFGGRMRLSHLLGCTIPMLRRDPQDRHARRLFYRICTEYGAAVARDIDLRWLISVCDTLADIGRAGDQRATGLLGSTLGNMIKLYETERRMFSPTMPWPPQTRFVSGGRLFDGMLGFSVSKGDMLRNYLARFERNLPHEPWADFTREILARLLKHDTVLSRMQYLNGRDLPEVLDPAMKAEIENILRQLPG